MISPGDRPPDLEVWLAPNERVSLRELPAEGERVLLLFYLFDWSST
ncbi:MAG: hypothetical protein ACR2L0_05445 [Gaiellaceae bacterium]